ncbi:MAG: hypothetical protein JXA22_03555 [Candidatus Thermoplasmatota archaeon]|nr:hypothetical protein [Candidatus Thermoplasmatota archaeon]
MEGFYLCSRTDILRNVNMDTGRKIALVGVPGAFKDWLEKVLPMDTFIVDGGEELPEGSTFDIIIYWDPGNIMLDIIDDLIGSLSDSGDLWVAVLHGAGRELLSSRYEVKETLVLNLTLTRDLVPVLLSIKDQKSPKVL